MAVAAQCSALLFRFDVGSLKPISFMTMNHGHPLTLLRSRSSQSTRLFQIGGKTGCRESRFTHRVTLLPRAASLPACIRDVADSGNNRINRYAFGSPAALTTHQAATACFGQVDCVHNSSGTSATTLKSPVELKVDGYGNLWIVDTGNYRVVVACMPPGTLGSVCTVNNAGDGTWDLVLGQADFVHAVSNCTTSPGANTLCAPSSVIPDVITGGQVFVSDSYPSGAARIQIFTSPWSNGMSATTTLGQASTTAALVPASFCGGGSNAGNACTETGNGDIYLIDSASSACPGGYCSYAIRPLRYSPVTMALTTRHANRSLWVMDTPGMVRWKELFYTGQPPTLVAGRNTNNAFDTLGRGPGYVENQSDTVGGGVVEAPDGSIWSAQGGGGNDFSAIWAMMDPEATPAPTALRSRPRRRTPYRQRPPRGRASATATTTAP